MTIALKLRSVYHILLVRKKTKTSPVNVVVPRRFVAPSRPNLGNNDDGLAFDIRWNLMFPVVRQENLLQLVRA